MNVKIPAHKILGLWLRHEFYFEPRCATMLAGPNPAGTGLPI